MATNFNININRCFIYPMVTRQDVSDTYNTENGNESTWKINSSLNTERNISTMFAQSVDRNFIIQIGDSRGFSVTQGPNDQDVNTITVQAGAAVIAGHLVVFTQPTSFTGELTGSGKLYIQLVPAQPGTDIQAADELPASIINTTYLCYQQKLDNGIATNSENSINATSLNAVVLSYDNSVGTTLEDSDFRGNKLLIATVTKGKLNSAITSNGFLNRMGVGENKSELTYTKYNADSIYISTQEEISGNTGTEDSIQFFRLDDVVNALRYTSVIDDGDYDDAADIYYNEDGSARNGYLPGMSDNTVTLTQRKATDIKL